MVLDVQELTEPEPAGSGYSGATLVPAGDVAALTRALATVAAEPGRRFHPPAGYGWTVAAARFGELFATLRARPPR